jgi:iron complex transport system substrate-binding protein
MKLFEHTQSFLAICALFASAAAVAEPLHLTDASGRELVIPQPIERIYCTSPVAAVFIYSLAPELLTGWNSKMSPTELAYLTPEARALPILGGWFGKSGTAKLETLLATQPDVILNIGPMTPTYNAFAKRMQAQSGIPVVIADGSLAACADVYELLGQLTGRQERAKELAAYCREKYQHISDLSAQIPAQARVRFYYAEGLQGLETDSETSPHTEGYRVAGGRNVCQLPNQGTLGRSMVSMEQILLWRPEVIFARRDKKDALTRPPKWLSDRKWQSIPAVTNSRVYSIPFAPFNWMDSPPSVNRMLGIQWAFSCLYPEQVDYDMIHEVQHFYQLFYHYELSEQEAKELLQM